jgi:hypothetical protein
MTVQRLVVVQHVLLVVVLMVVSRAEAANLLLAWYPLLSQVCRYKIYSGRSSKGYDKANHSNGWDAKLLAYVPTPRNLVAGLPGTYSTS